jgi:hypothetical protein
MPDLMWTWPQATAGAGLLAVAWIVMNRRGLAPRAQPAVHELSLIIGLYALWQLAGALSSGGAQQAVARGRWIWDAERALLVPSEAALQQTILPHPVLVEAANLYYYSAHFTALILLLIWLFVRHRDVYPGWRTALAVLTTCCLLIQFMPVAPPRLVPGIGIVDTAVLYHQSAYGTKSAVAADELSAMPSVHVAWALFVAVCLLRVTTSRWRYLGCVHAALTIWVVVVTGNHYWSDAIAAAALVVLTFVAQRCTRRLWARASPRWQGRLAAWSNSSWGVSPAPERSAAAEHGNGPGDDVNR